MKWLCRWWVWAPIVLVLCLGVVPFLGWIRPTIFIGMIEDHLSAEIGGDVTVRDIHWTSRWQLHMEGVVVHVPEVDGIPGDVLEVDAMNVQLDPLGSHWISNIDVQSATLRLAETRGNDWSLTLEQLSPQRSPMSDPQLLRDGRDIVTQLPSISIKSLKVLTGEVVKDDFHLIGSAEFEGSLIQINELGDFVFDLRESGGGTAALVGEWQSNSSQWRIDISGLSVGPDASHLIPFRVVRAYLRQLDLDATINLITLRLAPGSSPSVSMWLDRVTMLLDPTLLGIGRANFWERYPTPHQETGDVVPRLIATHGWLRYQDGQLSVMGLEGELAGGGDDPNLIAVPYRMSLSISDLPQFGLIDQFSDVEKRLSNLPFELDVTAWDTQFEPGRYADLPADVTRILRLFDVRQCTVQLGLAFDRKTIGGPVEMGGWLEIEDGLGAYAQFPYDLYDLHADIRLEGDDIKVHSLRALGSGDSTVEITGRVESSKGLDLAVRIDAVNVPLDRELLSAMPWRAKATLEDVFSEQHVDLPYGEVTDHQIVDLNLVIRQDEDENLTIEGEIPFDQLEVTWSEFPLLLNLGAGRIRWADELYLEREVGQPIAMKTAAGGIGTISGAIQIPMGEGDAGGRIKFDLHDESITDPFLKALNFVTDGELEALQVGHLTGVLHVDGEVSIDGDDATYDINATIAQGRLEQSPSLDTLVGLELAGLIGSDKPLRVDGSLHATTDELMLTPLSVRAGALEAQLKGTVRSIHEDIDLEIDAAQVNIGPWLLNQLDGDTGERAERLWSRWHPHGTFDVVAALGGAPARIVSAEVTGCTLTLDEHQTVSIEGGRLSLADSKVKFAALQLAATGPGGVSDILLAGEVSLDTPSGMLEFNADRLDLGLGLMQSVLHETAGAEALDIWQSLDFDGDVSLHGRWRDGPKSDWSINVEPRAVKATWHDQRIDFVDDAGSRLAIGPAGIEFTPLRGKIGDDARIAATGRLSFDPGRVDLRGSYDGSLHGQLLLAAGGSGWGTVLEAISLKDPAGSRIEDALIQLHQTGQQWTGEIDGRVVLRGASLEAGMSFEAVHAFVDTKLTVQRDTVTVMADVSHGGAMIQKTTLTDVHGRIVSDPTPEASSMTRIESLQGRLGGGRIIADAVVGGIDGVWNTKVLLSDARLDQLFPQTVEPGEQRSTGVVDASLYLKGRAGHPDDLVGVGDFRVTDGELATLPMLIAVQQLLHLSSPVVSGISFVDVDFIIRGSQATLENIVLASGGDGDGGFSLRGSGFMDLGTMEVNARLRPRGSWPVVSDVIGLVQDQLYEFSVTGPIGEPETGLVTLPGLSASPSN